jgi:hypothetical protein
MEKERKKQKKTKRSKKKDGSKIVQPEDAEDNEKPNTETRSVSQIPDFPSSPGETQLSMTGSPVPSTEPNLERLNPSAQECRI